MLRVLTWKGMGRLVKFRASGIAVALALAAPPAGAAVTASPPCDVPRATSWRQSAIDPARDLTELIEQSQKEHVLAVKDIQRSEGYGDEVDTSDRPISFCLAIVETDHGNSVYRFWYRRGAKRHYDTCYRL